MDELQNLKDRMELERPTPWNELPDIALYMDQLISYMPRQLIRFDDPEAGSVCPGHRRTDGSRPGP